MFTEKETTTGAGQLLWKANNDVIPYNNHKRDRYLIYRYKIKIEGKSFSGHDVLILGNSEAVLSKVFIGTKDDAIKV